MKSKIPVGRIFCGLCALFLFVCASSLHGQETPWAAGQPATVTGAQPAPIDDFDLLDAFLPGNDDPRDEDAKIMVMINCTVCHGPKDTKERLALRAGGDIVFWTGLVRKMNTTWNARIQEEDIPPIAGYLAKYFGPPLKKPVPASTKKPAPAKR